MKRFIDILVINVFFSIVSSVEAIRSSTCEWIYGDSGENVSCDVDRVLAGQCGSRDEECNNKTHGVYCCDIVEREPTPAPL